MKKNKTKYSWLLTPILACLMLTQVSCSNDIAENTSETVPGGTYLTIVTRGITTTDPGIYEDYVGELRVLAFDKAGDKVINVLLKGNDLNPEDETNSYVKVTKELPAGTISSGVYTFYFVANESDYNTTTSDETLTQALDAVSTEAGLKAIQVKTELTQTGQIKPSATNMLMSTEPYSALIYEGEVNKIGEKNHIELIRAFAKAQLALKLKEDGNNPTNPTPPSVTSVTLNGSYPDSFYLIRGTTNSATSGLTISREIAKDENGILFSGSTKPAPFYISQTIYLPECSYTADNAWKYHITIDGAEFTNAVIASKESDDMDYDINRNWAYTTIGTYNSREEVNNATFDVVVVQWEEKFIDVPAFE